MSRFLFRKTALATASCAIFMLFETVDLCRAVVATPTRRRSRDGCNSPTQEETQSEHGTPENFDTSSTVCVASSPVSPSLVPCRGSPPTPSPSDTSATTCDDTSVFKAQEQQQEKHYKLTYTEQGQPTEGWLTLWSEGSPERKYRIDPSTVQKPATAITYAQSDLVLIQFLKDKLQEEGKQCKFPRMEQGEAMLPMEVERRLRSNRHHPDPQNSENAVECRLVPIEEDKAMDEGETSDVDMTTGGGSSAASSISIDGHPDSGEPPGIGGCE